MKNSPKSDNTLQVTVMMQQSLSSYPSITVDKCVHSHIKKLRNIAARDTDDDVISLLHNNSWSYNYNFVLCVNGNSITSLRSLYISFASWTLQILDCDWLESVD